MAMSKSAAVDAAQAILGGARAAEMPRLDRIKSHLTPGRVSPVEIPQDAPEVMKRLAAKAEVNYLSLVVKSFSQVMKVDGYYTEASPEKAGPWQFWQRNMMDARQTATHRSMLAYGAAYEILLPGSKGPSTQGLSPRRLTAVYGDPAGDEWPMMALDVNGRMLKLYDETSVYYIGIENAPRGTFQQDGQISPDGQIDPDMHTALFASLRKGDLAYIESRTHDVGVCPVVRFRDRMLHDGEEQFGIVEPLLALNARIQETNYGLLVSQFFAAFKQRYVIGWVPKDEAEAMRANASDVWYFKDAPSLVSVGQFTETDLNQYINAKNDAKRDLAALAQIPVQTLGTDGVNSVSAEALASLNDGRDKESDEISTSAGESWEQWFRLAASIAGDSAGADDYSSEVRWADQTARSFAQTVDALGKMSQMLGYPQELLWEKIPGITDTELRRAAQLARRKAAQAKLATVGAAAAAARTDPEVAAADAQRGEQPAVPTVQVPGATA